MSDLFKRYCALQIGTRRFTDLRVVFHVEKNLRREPNKTDVAIYNLSEESRRLLQNTVKTPVELLAGYVDNVETIFTGNLAQITHAKTGPDWVTRFQAEDGGDALRTARFSGNFGKGTQAKDAIKKVADSMEVGLGNVVDAVKKGDFRKGFAEFKGVLTGPSVDSMDALMKSAGKEWSIQDGAIQVTDPGGTLVDEAVLLSPTTGLIGSPEVGEKGIVKLRALIQQRLRPARRLLLLSSSLKGTFRIEKVTFTGDSRGQEWYAELEVRLTK